MKADWSYNYYVIPSSFSFLFSSIVIGRVVFHADNITKKFHQLSLLIAIFDCVQCISWFIGPRYETETKLCHFQEYLFQIGTLGQGLTSVIICTTIFQAIRFGTVPNWQHKNILSWIIFGPICIILSASLNTAVIFCPFNEDKDFSHSNLSSTRKSFNHVIAYLCVYVFPMSVCFLCTVIYTALSTYFASRIASSKVNTVASQLRFYPYMLSICMFPLLSCNDIHLSHDSCIILLLIALFLLFVFRFLCCPYHRRDRV
jgi:hypothetical protein